MVVANFKRYMAFAKEYTYGVPAEPDNFFDTASCSFKFNPKRREVNVARSSAAQSVDELLRGARGSVEVMPNFETITPWLAALHNYSPAVAGGGPAMPSDPGPAEPILHTFRNDGRIKPTPWTIYTYPDARVHCYPGCIGTRLRLGNSRGSHFSIGLDFECADELDGGEIGSVDSTLFPAPIEVNAGANLLGGAQFSLGLWIGGVEQSGRGNFGVDIKYDRTLIYPERELTPERFSDNGNCSVTGRLTWLYNSTTYPRYAAYRDLSEIKIVATWTGAIIPFSASSNSLEVTLDNLYSTGRTPNWSKAGNGDIQLEMSFEAMLSESYGYSPYSIALTNTVLDKNDY